MHNIELSNQSLQLIEDAKSFAAKLGNPYMESIHVITVALDDESISFKNSLESSNVDMQSIIIGLKQELDKLTVVSSDDHAYQIINSSEFNDVIKEATALAGRKKASSVLRTHIFETILKKDVKVRNILFKAGMNDEAINAFIDIVYNNAEKTDLDTKFVDEFGIDFTEMAKNGKIDPIIGIDEPIRRVIQTLSRKRKNNPLLIGEPGIGKTSIAEGLALRIVSGNVPKNLQNVRLISLDMGQLVAGAVYNGEFEQRLKSVVKEVTDAKGKIILFIDEIHTIVGAGASKGAMDASNLMKPALARGEINCIGATTLDEYRKYIEKDTALVRRFQLCMVNEPSEKEAMTILRGIKPAYEAHHGLKISDSAIVAAVKLSSRYITDRFLPDKAIDVMDEAASKINMQVYSKPAEIEKLEQKIFELKTELSALNKDKQQEDQERIDQCEGEVIALENELEPIMEQWENEKTKLSKIKSLKTKIQEYLQEIEIGKKTGKFDEVAKTQYDILPSAQKELSELESYFNSNKSLMKEGIDEGDVADIVAMITGIPVDKMMKGEHEKLLHIDKYLENHVIGQKKAVDAVSNAVRRSRSGLASRNRPLASFMFLGTTGVGKTELAKRLAEFLFDDKKSMLRIDCSEYMEKHSVSKLIGSPPGYVGYDDGGYLTESLRKKPYQVVLFDEVEKAHPDIFNIMLQVLDDGRITDSKARVIDCSNAIFILTSNLGSSYISSSEEDDYEKMKNHVMKEVLSFFRPEMINRLDDILFFEKLKIQDMSKIVNLRLSELQKKSQELGIQISFTDNILKYLSHEGFDPEFGARPLSRVIKDSIENKMAEFILSKQMTSGNSYSIDCNEQNEIVII